MVKRRTIPAPQPYSPLDRKNLGLSVADSLLQESLQRLNDLRPFKGAGVYALYYSGKFSAYERLRLAEGSDEQAIPIYVGKAIPSGGRKSGIGVDIDPGTSLYKRLNEHAKNIASANNIELADFFCRFLVVEDIWIPLGESLMIEKFKPVWNIVADGFGNHPPGGGRKDQARSPWDMIHPGRKWANGLPAHMKSAEQILAEVRAHLRVEESTT